MSMSDGGDPKVEDYTPESTADTEPPPQTEPAVLIDQDCFLCVGIPREAPAGAEPPAYFYAFGFAEGVSQALRGVGYHLCANHQAVVRQACVERGINWGKPEPKRRLIT